MDLQLEQLKALVAVVDERHLRCGGSALRVTPSAISQRIKALELAVGRVLLQRVKPVKPTASGEVVLRLARQFALSRKRCARDTRPAR